LTKESDLRINDISKKISNTIKSAYDSGEMIAWQTGLSKETDGMWTSEEDFEKDIESYIGKKMDNFDYSDKLQAYQYIENKEWVKNILEGGSEKDKDFVNNFLSQMKDIFEI
jgi:hypothetical protein